MTGSNSDSRGCAKAARICDQFKSNIRTATSYLGTGWHPFHSEVPQSIDGILFPNTKYSVLHINVHSMSNDFYNSRLGGLPTEILLLILGELAGIADGEELEPFLESYVQVRELYNDNEVSILRYATPLLLGENFKQALALLALPDLKAAKNKAAMLQVLKDVEEKELDLSELKVMRERHRLFIRLTNHIFAYEEGDEYENSSTAKLRHLRRTYCFATLRDAWPVFYSPHTRTHCPDRVDALTEWSKSWGGKYAEKGVRYIPKAFVFWNTLKSCLVNGAKSLNCQRRLWQWHPVGLNYGWTDIAVDFAEWEEIWAILQAKERMEWESIFLRWKSRLTEKEVKRRADWRVWTDYDL